METQKLINDALHYIRHNTHDTGMTIADVAYHAGFSTDYFNRLFRRYTGYNVMEYLRFSRLSRAARLLRMTSREVLDIALECGYESHESFTRAFGQQYGKSPSEYREYYKNLPFTYAQVTDDTAANRFLKQFPRFSRADSQLVIEKLYERNALRDGFEAIVIYEYNGSRFFTEDDESYIILDEFGSELHATILSDDIDRVEEYIKLLRGFVVSNGYSLPGDPAEVMAEMEKRGIRTVNCAPYYAYTGDLVAVDWDYTIRPLTIDDVTHVKCFAAEYGSDWKVCESLEQRDVYHNAHHDHPLGIFDGYGKLIAITRTCRYEKFGYRIIEIEGTAALSTVTDPDFLNNSARAAMNLGIADGCIPYILGHDGTDGMDPVALGFENVKNWYTV
ncbi:MAG: helix-turn-helix transcriptional regulator [Clostridia bacterium]|nr:helix-turn-helix transcriptional regulator [Clostridia bacterium]